MIMSSEQDLGRSARAKENGYHVSGNNNAQLVRDHLDALKFHRFDTLPMGGVKFNWITRGADIDWTTFDPSFQIINHIPNEKQLSNKGLLLTNLRNYEMNRVKSTHYNGTTDNYRPLKTFVPETYLLDNPTDRINFKRTFTDGSLWICKPVGLSCGREVFVFRTQQQLDETLNDYHQHARNNRYCTLHYNRLVQKYIDQPLLIHKRKFDIRTYLLCVCTATDILCFAAQTGYLRLSMYEYNPDDLNKYIHLTNQSIQIKNVRFTSVRNETGMTMEQFNDYFNEYIHPTMPDIERDWVLNQLPQRITRIIGQVSDSVRANLSIREGCFGFYGVDILLDNKLNCWLLEINSGPTLDTTNAALENVIPMCLETAISVVIESLDNYRLLGSALPLRKSNLFKYLPPMNRSMINVPTMAYYAPPFTTVNNRRIDLTPGVLVSFHRYRRRSSSLMTNNRFTPSPNRVISRITQKVKSTAIKRVPISGGDDETSSANIAVKRKKIVHNVSMKTNREQFSNKLTELILTNNDQDVQKQQQLTNIKHQQQEQSTVISTHKWTLPMVDMHQIQTKPLVLT